MDHSLTHQKRFLAEIPRPSCTRRCQSRFGTKVPTTTIAASVQQTNSKSPCRSVQAHGLSREMLIVSDDAGQFDVGHHALCWVHAERLVHKLDTFTDLHRAAAHAHSSGGSMMISRYIALRPLPGAVANCVHASTASSIDAPASSRSIACSCGCTPTGQGC